MTRTSSEGALVVSTATNSLLARGRGGEKKVAILRIPQTLLSLQYTAVATLRPSTSAAIRAHALDVDAFLDRRVKIYYIDTHRLTELCDTEGATKYPLGTLGTPIATPEEVANYPPGNPGCTPEEARAVSAGRRKDARHAGARTRLKGPRSHTCPPHTPEVWEGRPRATERQASAGAPPLSDGRHTAPRSEWRATRRSPSGTHSEECVAQRSEPRGARERGLKRGARHRPD